MRLEPGVLLAIADEMAGLAGEREPESGLAILSAHAALEAFVNETGAREIASFNLRARFLPKWHDLCERVLGRQLDSGPDLERLQAIRDALVGYEGEAERLDRRSAEPATSDPGAAERRYGPVGGERCPPCDRGVPSTRRPARPGLDCIGEGGHEDGRARLCPPGRGLVRACQARRSHRARLTVAIGAAAVMR